jgi:hypothetical protein
MDIWLLHSWDLSPSYIFLEGYVKDKFCPSELAALEYLKGISEAIYS